MKSFICAISMLTLIAGVSFANEQKAPEATNEAAATAPVTEKVEHAAEAVKADVKKAEQKVTKKMKKAKKAVEKKVEAVEKKAEEVVAPHAEETTPAPATK
ncbi:MAG: hypothetical protein ACKOA8_14475 [Deltaproteobacteria bacterium]